MDFEVADMTRPSYDIALLRLAQPTDAPAVQLPATAGAAPPATQVWAAGYGLTETGEGSTEVLRCGVAWLTLHAGMLGPKASLAAVPACSAPTRPLLLSTRPAAAGTPT